MTKPKTKISLLNKTNGGGHQFTVDRGIPLASRKKPNPFHDLFLSMKTGDSFLIGDDKEKISRVHYHSGKWGKENNSTFAFRNTDQGRRCWKIK